MIPYEVDPSLHNDKPHETVLDDGFSPPVAGDTVADPAQPATPAAPQPVAPGLWEKSGF